MTRSEPTEMAEELRSRGLRATPQRMAVWEAVAGSKAHPCAEEVYRQVRRRLPSISLGTVYKALGELRDVRLLKELPISGKLRVDPNIEPHHHLVCERCKRVVDVPLSVAPQKPRMKAVSAGFEILGSEVTFWGICPKCREPSKAERASKEQVRRKAS